jgi:outer membrane receptor protein involved in Fe transport
MKKIIGSLSVVVLILSSIIFPQNIPSNIPRGAAGQIGALSGPGSISGKIVDSITQKAIDYASVALYKDNSSKPVNGTITDSDGKFQISKVPLGKYKLKITFMGFNNKSVDSVLITGKNSSIELGVIPISQKSMQLQGVEITGQKGPVEFQVDKMVVNVEKTLPSAGGSVLDVLKNTPSVSVDMDGNVSLRGNGNITFLLDGRPSGMVNPKMLEQIPASALENIEIVTNPSAKYDADGTAGIINFIMKKQKEMNWNGLFQANAGTKDNYGSSVNLNFKKDNYNFYGSYDNRYTTRLGNGVTDRWTEITGIRNDIHQDIDQTYRTYSHNFKLGMDYSFNDFNSITTSFLYNTGKGRRNAVLQNTSTSSLGEPLESYTTNNHGDSRGESFDYLLNYKKTFEQKGKEWTVDFYYTRSNNIEDNDRIVNYSPNMLSSAGNPWDENSCSSNGNKLFSLKTDYVIPLEEAGKIETGYKGIYRKRDINYNVSNYNSFTNVWINDINQSNVFDYEEQIHAAYVMYSNKLGGFKYQAGLRLEEALTKSWLENTGTEYKKDYFSPIPTLHLSQEVAEGQELKLSYSRRLNRPQMQLINPFLKNIDQQMQFQGNPYLKPEYTDSYEFGYAYVFNASSIFTNLFYKQVNDNISQITELRSNNMTVQTFSNVSKLISYGIELNGYSQLFKWWTINGGVSYYASKYDGSFAGSPSNRINDVWNARIMTMISLGWDLDFQFNGFYMSRNLTPQGKMKEMVFTDISLKKSLFEKKLSISLRVSDPFKLVKFRNEVFGQDFYYNINFTPVSQIFTLSVSYSMNNFKKIFERKPEEDSGAREYEDNGQQR